MDALLTTFLAALLAEWGDRTQLLAALLAVRFRAIGPVLAAVIVAAFANSLIAAFGGGIVADMINFRAVGLMVGLALLATGAGGLLRQKPPDVPEAAPFGAFASSAFALFVLGFGDKTQFLTFGLAARADSLWLAACGATAGIAVAAAPAVMLGGRFPELPLRAIRTGFSCLFLLAGMIVAVSALRLV